MANDFGIKNVLILKGNIAIVLTSLFQNFQITYEITFLYTVTLLTCTLDFDLLLRVAKRHVAKTKILGSDEMVDWKAQKGKLN